MYCMSSKQKDISKISKCILGKPMKVKFYINSSFKSNSLLLHVLNITFCLNEEADVREEVPHVTEKRLTSPEERKAAFSVSEMALDHLQEF